MKYNKNFLNNIRKISLIFHAFYDYKGNIFEVEENLPILKNSPDWEEFKNIYLEKFNFKINNGFFNVVKDEKIISKLKDNFHICKLNDNNMAYISKAVSDEYYDFREEDTPSVFFHVEENDQILLKVIGNIMLPITILDLDAEFLEDKYEFQEYENLFEFVIDNTFINNYSLIEQDFTYPELLSLIKKTIIWK